MGRRMSDAPFTLILDCRNTSGMLDCKKLVELEGVRNA